MEIPRVRKFPGRFQRMATIATDNRVSYEKAIDGAENHYCKRTMEEKIFSVVENTSWARVKLP